ncbi:Regulating synaptic membrane exocytosis protein 1 [Turdus rufiventris]|nr:Regulating synaptic membrane exocytosis protein 1 [Turdus rufiventris]
MQELPDLSHLTEEERNIIMAVMDRQKEEEEKEEAMLNVKTLYTLPMVACLVDEGKTVGVVYLDFSKAIDTDFLWRKWQPMA